VKDNGDLQQELRRFHDEITRKKSTAGVSTIKFVSRNAAWMISQSEDEC
jgi:hypothetical protein